MSDSGSSYEHWPDDASTVSATSAAATGYDGKNGLREFIYQPAKEEKKEKKEPPPEPPKPQPVPYAYQPPAHLAPRPPFPMPVPPQVQPPYMNCYPGLPYPGYNMAVPAPAYYGYPPHAYGHPGYPQVYAAAPAPPKAEEKKEKPKKASPRTWQGRTVAEVEEDNMKIAKREGAYEARKVEPIGLKEDQVVWVVGVDKSPTLQ